MAASERDGLLDLRALEIVSDFNTHLMCLVCHCPFIQPVRLRCDHIFCQDCLSDCIRTSPTFMNSSNSDGPSLSQPDDFLCPTCRSPTNATFSTVPRLIIAMCDDIPVKCPFSAAGCSEVVQRGHVQSHVDKYCDYRFLDCPDITCGKKIRKKDFVSSEKCLHVHVDCEDCLESVPKLDLEKHKNELCPLIPRTCPDCDENLLNNEFEAHAETCTRPRIRCDASRFGCPIRAGKDEIDEHQKICPLISLAPYLDSQATCIASMDSTIRQLKQQNEILEDGIATIRTTFSQTTSRPPSRVQLTTNTDTTNLPLPDFQNSSPSPPALTNPDSNNASSTPNLTTTYLLSIHESLRDEVAQLSNAIVDLDARARMSMMNENLRIREDMAHISAGLNTVRMQVHMLINSRLHHGPRTAMNPHSPAGTGAGSSAEMGTLDNSNTSSILASGSGSGVGTTHEVSQRSRRLSDSGWEGTKL
ncbi:hypothetical protein FQN57_005040 [Myotisia sp. PD_48]|nr:hypothetical protein FQN57_005040 [Myotisia sp. PD_48]